MGMLAGNGAGAGCCFYAGTVRAGGAECGGKLFRDRDAIIRLMMWSMLYLEKRAPLLDRMPMEGVHRAFLESYIAVPVRLVEECPRITARCFGWWMP